MRLNELIKKSENIKCRICVVCPHDTHTLEAISTLNNNFTKVYFVGNQKLIQDLITNNNYLIENLEYINSDSLIESSKIACNLVNENKVDVLVKGLLDTSIILREVVNRETGIRKSKRLSHLTLFDNNLYHKVLLMSDGAMNIKPDIEVFKSIIENVVDCAHQIGIEIPKVALLAAKEKVDDNMPITHIYQEIKNTLHINAVIDGPFALDNALSKEACLIKSITSDVAGDADILIVPEIESGNILYKGLAYLSHTRFASLVLGAKCPLVVTSRADTLDTKINSIKLALRSLDE